jgi:hypothetical protein
MSAQQPTIIYTLTDEAPLLATYALLPVIRAFAAPERDVQQGAEEGAKCFIRNLAMSHSSTIHVH